jgi:hypothetical protein
MVFVHTVRPGTMLAVVRRPAVILTLLATAVLLIACGSSGHPPASTGRRTPPATSAPTGAARPLTKAQAIAFARAVNLTAADVPGFEVTSAHEHEPQTTAEKQLERELAHCTGATLNSRNGLAEASSKHFKLEHNLLDLSVSSKVSVTRTPALAAKELAAIRSNHVRGCLSHYLNLLLENQIAKDQRFQATIPPGSISVSISQGTPPAPGVTGSFAWLITATIAVRNVRVPFYLDILGFVNGPSEVTLLSFGALRPFPATIQEHLYRLLLERARTHSA